MTDSALESNTPLGGGGSQPYDWLFDDEPTALDLRSNELSFNLYFGGSYDFRGLDLGTLNIFGSGIYVTATQVDTVSMLGNFGYVNTQSLLESVAITGNYNGTFAREAKDAYVTINDATGASFYSYNFEDGRMTVRNSDATNIYNTDADYASYDFTYSNDSYVRIEGDYVELQSWFSSFDTLQLRGEDAGVDLVYSQVDAFQVGNWGEVDLFRSFVNGEVGYGAEVSATGSRIILELDGKNEVTVKGGQALLDAENGTVDEFVFTDGAQVDGQFDWFDEVTLASGATWTIGELTSQNDEGETTFIDGAGQFELGATIYEAPADDFMFA